MLFFKFYKLEVCFEVMISQFLKGHIMFCSIAILINRPNLLAASLNQLAVITISMTSVTTTEAMRVF